MRSKALLFAGILLFSWPVHAREQVRLDDFLQVVGRVRAIADPVGDALVIALNLADASDVRTFTNRTGEFELPPLPVGVYRVIAVKHGFAPAVATVTPTRKQHRLVMNLEDERTASQSAKDRIWEIRRTLPKDILRDIDAVLASTADPVDSPPRFAGNMMSVAGFSDATSTASLEHTTVALRGDLGGWNVDFQGRRQLLDDGVSLAGSADPAQAADVVLEVRSSPGSAYRIASSRAYWHHQPRTPEESAEVGVEAHSIAWQGESANVALRYLGHQNLFEGDLGPSDLFEIAGDTRVYRSPRADVGVAVTLTQETANSNTAPSGESYLRYADVMASGRFTPVRALGVDYGLLTRASIYGIEYIPQTGAALKLGDSTQFRVAAAYKLDSASSSVSYAPAVSQFSSLPLTSSHYRYAVSISQEIRKDTGIAATASVTEADGVAFVLFDDRFEEFWDGLYLERGDVMRDVTIQVHSMVGSALSVVLQTSAGSVDGPDSLNPVRKTFVAGEVKSFFEPSGTSMDVMYRRIDQPDVSNASLENELERLNVVMGQALHLPVDLRVIVGIALTRESQPQSRSIQPSEVSRRVVGGVVFSF